MWLVALCGDHQFAVAAASIARTIVLHLIVSYVATLVNPNCWIWHAIWALIELIAPLQHQIVWQWQVVEARTCRAAMEPMGTSCRGIRVDVVRGRGRGDARHTATAVWESCRTLEWPHGWMGPAPSLTRQRWRRRRLWDGAVWEAVVAGATRLECAALAWPVCWVRFTPAAARLAQLE